MIRVRQSRLTRPDRRSWRDKPSRQISRRR
jgi:hypothetical protein